VAFATIFGWKKIYKMARFKNQITKNRQNSLFYEREIWFCSVGMNLGHEEDGKQDQFLRPIIILKNLMIIPFGAFH